MLVGIGSRHDGGDAVDLLLACHGRIRRFASLAAQLAASAGAGPPPEPAEVRETAASVERYFTVALPLHARDEDESVLPRLLGREAALDEALGTMRREHGEHAADVDRLTGLCATIAADPARLAALRTELADAAARLSRRFEAHLGPEEALIFPALRRLLPPAELAAITHELRARRG